MTMDTGSMGRLESMFIMVIYLGAVSGYVCWRGSGEWKNETASLFE